MQRGDVVTVTAPGRYEQPAGSPGLFAALGAFVASLLHPAQPPAPGLDPLAGRRGLPLLQLGVAAGLTQLPQLGGGVPRGYLRVLVFDKDSALVDQYVRPLSSAALHNYEDLRLQVTLAQDGYVTVYVGN